MACVDEEQKPNFKHYCRVCKKGFMCGRALGGHMRAHGIGDESANYVDDDDEDETSDWEDKHGGSDHKRMYQLRANPNRLKSSKVCENCGKEFLSWKSFLEHGKYCGSDGADDDDHSLVSSPGSDGEEYNIGGTKGYGWSKRKRSLRTKVGTFTSPYNNTYSSEQEDLLLAKWLIDLANARVDPSAVEPEESCASASNDEERRNRVMAYLCTSGLMNKDRDLEHPRKSTDFFMVPSLDKAKGASRGLFECKACNKVFKSHQALGGHRASHKKVKGCYAAKQDQLDDNDVITHGDNYFEGSNSSSYYQIEQGTSLTGASKRKSKVHECSICHRVFSTGQALGGHKRCHWITSNSQGSSIFTPKFHFHNPLEKINERSTLEKQDPLDLNIPPDEDIQRIRQEPWNIINPLEVSTDIYLHPWTCTNSDHPKKETKDDVVYHNNYEHPREKNEGDDFKDHDNNNNNTDKNNSVHQDNATQTNVEDDDDEANSKLKLAKLSDLNDINTISGSPSQWLQVGIGPTTEVKADS